MKCQGCHNTITENDRYCKTCGENNPNFLSENDKTSNDVQQSKSTSNSMNNTYTEKPVKDTIDHYEEKLKNEKQKLEAQHSAYVKEFYNQRDYANIGVILLAFIIPFVGLIISISWRKEFPHKSAQVLNSSIVGFIINSIVLMIVY